MLFFTNKFIPPEKAGKAVGPFAFVRPKHKDDIGLIEHEKTHIKQWCRLPLSHDVKYKNDRDYRLKCEVEAYRVQLEYSPHDLNRFSRFLAKRYGLGITVKEAEELLNEA